MLLRIEIFVFFLSFIYSFYYIWDLAYIKLQTKKLKEKERSQKREEVQQKIIQAEKKAEKILDGEVKSPPTKTVNPLSSEDLEKLREIIKRVQLNKMRGYYDTARSLVIEGLSIEKNHMELNLELAEIYELEEKHQNAEFIYKDILWERNDDFDVLVRLGNNLVKQEKLSDAVQVYKLAYEKKKDNIDVLESLSRYSFDIKNYTDALKFAKIYLKYKPRNPEILGIKWYCLEKDGKIEEAIETYQKIVEVQPYNNEIKDRIQEISQNYSEE